MASKTWATLPVVCLSACCLFQEGEHDTTHRDSQMISQSELTGELQGHTLVFGDFGQGECTCQQEIVGKAIESANDAKPFDLAFHVGDNLGSCGPNLANIRNALDCKFNPDNNTVPLDLDIGVDPQFRKHFEDYLVSLKSPIYMALGNHDIVSSGDCDMMKRGTTEEEERLKACLEIQHVSDRWVMPARHYVVDQGRARFIVLDTVLLAGDHAGFRFEEEVEFAKANAEGCGDTRFCFIMGHYYPNVAADADGRAKMVSDESYKSRVKALEDALDGKIAAWFGGHAHDQQHLRTAVGYDVFIASTTSMTKEKDFAGPFPSGEVKYWSLRWGFGVLDVRTDGWEMKFMGTNSQPLHCCRTIEHGRCEPYTCAEN